MRALLGVELSRLRARRTPWVLALVAVLIGLGFAAQTAHDTRPVTADERATATAQAEIEARSADVQRVLRSCEQDPAGFVGPGATAADCARTLTPTAADFLDRSPLRVPTVMRHGGLSVALLTLVLVALLGAAFAGADWTNGSLATQLLAEPRRRRVWIAKAGAAAVGGLVVAALASLALWAPLLALAGARDVPVPGDLAWYVARLLALAVLVAVVAHALTMLFRQTVVSVGILLGVSLAAEVVLGILPVPSNGWLSPSHNVYAWIIGRTRYLDPSVACSVADCHRARTLEMWPAAALMAGVAVVLGAVSVAVFSRRDLP